MKNKILLSIFAFLAIAFASTASAYIYSTPQGYYLPNSNYYNYYQPDYFYSSPNDYHYVSPHFSYNYYEYPNQATVYISLKDYGYNGYYDGFSTIYYWDDYDLKWRKDPISAWINKGDWRERTKRARAINFLIRSWDERYAIASGRETGDVFSYTDGAKDTVAESSTNWRYKEAYDPLVHGDGYGGENYYYKPRYDSQTQTYNWRY